MKSFVTPFNVSGGRIAVTSDPARIMEQKVIDVLVTGKMERPTLPAYGAGVQQLLFDSIDELVEADFKTDAGLELARRITGLDVVDLRVTQDDFSTATITVVYRTTLSAVRTLTFQITSGLLTEETPI